MKTKGPLKILCIGAHSDDIEIGCGATLLKMIEEYGTKIEIVWAVFSANGERERESKESADFFLRRVSRKKIVLHHFRDGFFPSAFEAVKEKFEEIKKEISPDIIFTHYREDRHQDHRIISDVTWNTFRDHMILEYEVPKYDGDFGSPNLFVEVDEKICRKKTTAVLRFFQTQKKKHWMTEETLLSVLRLRGIESGRRSRYAEAFYCRKMIL